MVRVRTIEYARNEDKNDMILKITDTGSEVWKQEDCLL